MVSETHNYNKDINFTINKVEEGFSISTGSGSINPTKGLKFVFLTVSFKNNSDVKQQLHFENIFLLDPNSHTKYKVEFSMLVSAFNITGSLDPKIKKGDIEDRRLVFAFPKDVRAEMLEVNDEVYNLQYTNPKN